MSSDELSAKRWVQVTTWNVKGKEPPKDLLPLLGLDRNPDIIAIGLQESCLYHFDLIYKDKWARSINKALTKKGYKKVKKVRMTGTVLYVYTQKFHTPSVFVIESSVTRTNKNQIYSITGGTSLRIKFYGNILSFVNARLDNQEISLKKRVEEYFKIEKKRSRNRYHDDYTFWFGNLNFKLYDLTFGPERIIELLEDGKLFELLNKDQLNELRSTGVIFKEYNEAPITFKPTYKYQVGTDKYNLMKRPGWTDRILYRCTEGRQILPLYYDTVLDFNISDHKPVEATFKIFI